MPADPFSFYRGSAALMAAYMATKLTAARQLTRYAAERYDSGDRCDMEAGMASCLPPKWRWRSRSTPCASTAAMATPPSTTSSATSSTHRRTAGVPRRDLAPKSLASYVTVFCASRALSGHSAGTAACQYPAIASAHGFHTREKDPCRIRQAGFGARPHRGHTATRADVRGKVDAVGSAGNVAPGVG
jgi:hypothetical protein